MQNQVENRKFSPSRVLCASAKGVSLGWLPALAVKKNWNDGLPGRKRSLTTSSVVWMQYTNVTDGQIDGRRDTEQQQRPRLRIVSPGKME